MTAYCCLDREPSCDCREPPFDGIADPATNPYRAVDVRQRAHSACRKRSLHDNDAARRSPTSRAARSTLAVTTCDHRRRAYSHRMSNLHVTEQTADPPDCSLPASSADPRLPDTARPRIAAVHARRAAYGEIHRADHRQQEAAPARPKATALDPKMLHEPRPSVALSNNVVLVRSWQRIGNAMNDLLPAGRHAPTGTAAISGIARRLRDQGPRTSGICTPGQLTIEPYPAGGHARPSCRTGQDQCTLCRPEVDAGSREHPSADHSSHSRLSADVTTDGGIPRRWRPRSMPHERDRPLRTSSRSARVDRGRRQGQAVHDGARSLGPRMDHPDQSLRPPWPS